MKNSCPIVEAVDLGRNYGTKAALSHVTLEFPPGRVIGLLGPNGAGKTTLLRLIAGTIEPRAGRVNVKGLPARSPDRQIRQNIACMLDGGDPPAWATARDLVRLQAEALPTFDSPQAVASLKNRGIQSDAAFSSLSKGQRRWLLATLAMASGAPLLLLDEPADGLDTAARRDLYDQARHLANQGSSSVLISTHILTDIERVADDILILNHGRLILHEDLEQLREQLREVETAAAPSRDQLTGCRVFAERATEDGFLSWIQCPGGEEHLQQRLKDAVLRPVTVEELYLLLTTGPGGEPAAPRLPREEKEHA